MSAIGGQVFEGISKIWSGPLGVVQLGFKGYDLGKTTADTTLTPDQDIKDIIYQQDGTKASDHVRTGQDMIVSATFGEIKTGLLLALMAGTSSNNVNPNSDSMTFSRNLYGSMRAEEAGGLRIISVDAEGNPSEDLEDRLSFYEAIPIITGELINWGADTQRNLPVEFRIKYHKFAEGESSTKAGAYGFLGDPTVEDVPAIVWPDVAGPSLVSATATDATTLEVVFDENIAFQTAFDSADYVGKVNNKFVVPSAGVISTTTLTLTFPASTFTAGDIIELSIGGDALEDTEATPNAFGGVNDKFVTNNVV